MVEEWGGEGADNNKTRESLTCRDGGGHQRRRGWRLLLDGGVSLNEKKPLRRELTALTMLQASPFAQRIPEIPRNKQTLYVCTHTRARTPSARKWLTLALLLLLHSSSLLCSSLRDPQESRTAVDGGSETHGFRR